MSQGTSTTDRGVSRRKGVGWTKGPRSNVLEGMLVGWRNFQRMQHVSGEEARAATALDTGLQRSEGEEGTRWRTCVLGKLDREW